jgi:hypothetical protein
MTVSISGTNGVTFPDSSLQAAAASPYVLKNRIINGDMVINQRAFSGTPTDGAYTLDRWYADLSPASKFTVSQNAGSVTPPVGFVNYLGVTSSSAYSISATDIFTITQRIEGYNISDFSWGTASAKTVTLSFWVRSSLTGTFGGALRSNANGRCYPFTYSIPTANTWTQISVTIAGETSGTWLSTNGNGVSVTFGLGVGSTYSGTAGAWSSNLYFSATGATSVVGTNGATWYITGVQLEIGSSATPFERRLYNQELANCQRYYQTLPFDAGYVSVGATLNTNSVRGPLFQLNVNMRATPTITLPTAGSGAGQLHYTNSSGAVPSTIGTNSALGVQVNSFRVEGDGYTSAFSAGQAVLLRVGTGGGASITASAEL